MEGKTSYELWANQQEEMAQLYSGGWFTVRVEKMYEEGKAVGKSELTTELLFYPEDGGGTLLRNSGTYYHSTCCHIRENIILYCRSYEKPANKVN
jgi:hypothetical protein